MRSDSRKKMALSLMGIVLALVCLAGCARIGPASVARDRFDYVSAISESWKRQTLLNLVKLRYLDTPVYMEVTAVINQYALETEIEASFSWNSKGVLGTTGSFIDRPTITYTPLMGERSARILLRPMELSTIMLLVQSGYPADFLFRICVQAINGLQNNRSGSIAAQAADPRFYQLTERLSRLQRGGGFALRALNKKEGRQLIWVFRTVMDNEVTENQRQVRQMLGLDETAMEFNLVHGTFNRSGNEIAVFVRSLYEVMRESSACIQVPDDDIDRNRTYSLKAIPPATGARIPCLQVHSADKRPGSAFVAIEYRDHWFWIDDEDVHSKEIFSFLLLLFSFAEKGESTPAAPVITIPTN